MPNPKRHSIAAPILSALHPNKAPRIINASKPKRVMSPLVIAAGTRNCTQGRIGYCVNNLASLIHHEIPSDRDKAQLLGMLSTIRTKLSKVVDENWMEKKRLLRVNESSSKIPS